MVGTLERLNLLLLLTFADHRGVGPGVWTAWKAALLWQLYGEARAHLKGRPVRSDEERRTRMRIRIVEGLAGRFPASLVERHLAMLPEKYLRTESASDVGGHLDLVARLEQRPLVVAWRDLADEAHTELTVCARDAVGLFARLAGALSANGLDILSVDVYTREDGVVLDTFTVREALAGRAVAEGRRSRVEEDLDAAVTGRLDVAAAVELWRAGAPGPKRRRGTRRAGPPTVRFDSEASPVATVVEVGAEDTLGLAYRIASTLSGLGLNITFAKIASEKSRAWDVFYVTDAEGRKLGTEQRESVTEALMSVLGDAVEKGNGNKEGLR
jgi:[protein-PII] uridylyltransferase